MATTRVTSADAALAEPPAVPRTADGPVFAEPWQASAFALAVSLSHQGHISRKEWAAALGEELTASAARGEPTDGSHYYHCWLATLAARKEAWADAYRRTPHGKPIELPVAAGGTNE